MSAGTGKPALKRLPLITYKNTMKTVKNNLHKVTVELDAIETIETLIPALLRKQDEVSHKLAGILINAVTDKWKDTCDELVEL